MHLLQTNFKSLKLLFYGFSSKLIVGEEIIKLHTTWGENFCTSRI